jgi:hypothetical protein
MQVLMPTRILGNARDDLEPESEIKPGCLEAVRGKNYLKTIPSSCLPLCQLQKAPPDAQAADFLMHPELSNLATSAPRVAAEPGDDFVLIVTLEDRKTQRVTDPSRLGVEFIEPILKQPDLCGGWIRSYD